MTTNPNSTSNERIRHAMWIGSIKVGKSQIRLVKATELSMVLGSQSVSTKFHHCK